LQTINQILEQYWGYKSFRPLQEDIINSLLQGNDTLVLMPTSGGKSICFQVPALAKEGICVVISPLISLMKDQVEGLKARDIKAVSITSAMHKREIDITLDNCVHGNIKFLYLSPERLESEIVKVRLQKMNINFIAIDEAHCISQWGYDFRPSYLKIAELRELLPNIPVIALTATATKEVVSDIQEKLLFKKKNLFQQSFERKNLAYVVQKEENKFDKLKKIINGIGGSGIIYARNRRKTQEIAAYLKENNFTADYYHAGLLPAVRDAKQNNWMQNKSRIMVATNAFGMGIDKPDVRFVVHLDLPDSLEAYFQEAGRAGRDARKAYAVLLYSEIDKLELRKNIENSFPNIEEIKKVYQALANYFQVATGAGKGVTFSFDLTKFCDTYTLNSYSVFHCLKFIDREGYITLTDAINQPSRIKIEVNREELYRFQLANDNYDAFIKLLLRNYTGLFDGFVKISEYDLGQKSAKRNENITKRLEYLHQNKIVTYLPQTELPQLTFTRERVDINDFSLSKENYALLKKKAIERMEAVLHYAESNFKCRSQLLLSYFGETTAERCNQCDVCIEENKKILHTSEFESISNQINQLLALHPLDIKGLVDRIIDAKEEKVLHTIQWMLDNDLIVHTDENKLVINQ